MNERQISQIDSAKELTPFWNTDDRIGFESELEEPTSPVQFITDTAGRRVGALLDMVEYHRLNQNVESNPEFIFGLSNAELEVLSLSKLALPTQARVDELLVKNVEMQLSSDENAELDHLLEQIDQLTTLKTRVRYTLYQYKKVLPVTA